MAGSTYSKLMTEQQIKKNNWLVVEPTPLKNDGVKVSLDDDIPNMMGKNNPNVPNHQPDKLSNYPSTWFLQITCLLHPVAIPSWKKGLRFYTIV